MRLQSRVLDTLDGASINYASPNLGTGITATNATLVSGSTDNTILEVAAKNSGLGKSTGSPAGTSINLPAASYKGSYTAALTYTLSDIPA